MRIRPGDAVVLIKPSYKKHIGRKGVLLRWVRPIVPELFEKYAVVKWNDAQKPSINVPAYYLSKITSALEFWAI